MLTERRLVQLKSRRARNLRKVLGYRSGRGKNCGPNIQILWKASIRGRTGEALPIAEALTACLTRSSSIPSPSSLTNPTTTNPYLFFLSIVVKDRSSHRSVILDLCPTQWLLSAQHPNPRPLSFDIFLSHPFVFLNSHIANKRENSLAVFDALLGKGRHFPSFSSLFSKLKQFSVLFFSSEEAGDSSTAEVVQPHSNPYRVFKTVGQSLVKRIPREFNILVQPDTEGASRDVRLVNEC